MNSQPDLSLHGDHTRLFIQSSSKFIEGGVQGVQLDVKPIISEVDWCHEPMVQSRGCVLELMYICLHARVCTIHENTTPPNDTPTRVGALMLPSSCLDGSTTRVCPGQYPQYTRAWFAREAVGSSPTAQFSQRRTHAPTVFFVLLLFFLFFPFFLLKKVVCFSLCFPMLFFFFFIFCSLYYSSFFMFSFFHVFCFSFFSFLFSFSLFFSMFFLFFRFSYFFLFFLFFLFLMC